MQLNIGKVMNFAAKAGFPKVEKAYPSMALGTAEATPLQVATAYTMFANLGDRVLPMPIKQITAGDGRTISLQSPDKKTVVRPDVAYVMDDIMKDVINRGTAASAQAWGFRNVAGKTAFAGKTGTSRDGWFAGFTPELVCVVYVGFDNGDDLGSKGSDSAMPIWADFMQQSLNIHPEWNGDWAMPGGIKQAEIDIRNGTLIANSALMISAVGGKTPPDTHTHTKAGGGPECRDLRRPIAAGAERGVRHGCSRRFRRWNYFHSVPCQIVIWCRRWMKVCCLTPSNARRRAQHRSLALGRTEPSHLLVRSKRMKANQDHRGGRKVHLPY
ncbi:MAG: hypothetical protein IPP63_03375 [Chloracidobacterium sp.]|nr:hypothetical protein [Chloracidobacterium sp.]